MDAVSLVDTNVLVYAHDPRSPGKQRRAIELLQRSAEEGALVLPHQVVIEFVAAVTRPVRGGTSPGGGPLLGMQDAIREADEYLQAYEILYPTEDLVRRAFLGAYLYSLPWYDAHLWAYADFHGIGEILTEDFQHDRLYGSVRTVNPFRDLG